MCNETKWYVGTWYMVRNLYLWTVVNVLRDDLVRNYNEVSHFAKIVSDTFLNFIVWNCKIFCHGMLLSRILSSLTVGRYRVLFASAQLVDAIESFIDPLIVSSSLFCNAENYVNLLNDRRMPDKQSVSLSKDTIVPQRTNFLIAPEIPWARCRR